MAAKLRATWALLFWTTWPTAVNRALLLDERSFNLYAFWSIRKSLSNVALRSGTTYVMSLWSKINNFRNCNSVVLITRCISRLGQATHKQLRPHCPNRKMCLAITVWSSELDTLLMRYGVKFTSYRIKSVYKSLDQTVEGRQLLYTV